jgi:hypothetical protein
MAGLAREIADSDRRLANERRAARAESYVSGRGEASTVPPELKRWNWGAFLLNWVWALAHGVWFGLFALIPGVSFVVALVLGSKGNELAWRKREWESVESFQRTQRTWSHWGLVIWAVGVVLSVVVAVVAPSDNALPTDATQDSLQVIASRGDVFDVEIPGGWRQGEPISDVDLHVTDRASAFVIGLVHERSEQDTLTRVTTTHRDALKSDLVRGTQPRSADHITIGGFPAVKSELHGTEDGEAVVYVHMVVETSTRYIELIGSSTEEAWPRDRAVIDHIFDSLSVR